jgi:hypothetical protein
MAVVETRQDALTPQRKAAIEQEFRSPLSPRSPNVSAHKKVKNSKAKRNSASEQGRIPRFSRSQRGATAVIDGVDLSKLAPVDRELALLARDVAVAAAADDASDAESPSASPHVAAVHATPPRAAARPLAVAYGAEAAGPFTPEPTKPSPAAQAVRAAVAIACKGLSPFLRGAASPAQANGVATSSTRVHAPQFCPI